MAFLFVLLTFSCSTAFVGYLLGLEGNQIGLLVLSMIAINGIHTFMFGNVLEHNERLASDEEQLEARLVQNRRPTEDEAKRTVQQQLKEFGMEIDLEDIGTSKITHTSKEKVGVYMDHDIYEYVIINGKYMYTYEHTTTKGRDGKWVHKCKPNEMLTGNGVVYVYAGRVDIEDAELPSEDKKSDDTP